MTVYFNIHVLFFILRATLFSFIVTPADSDIQVTSDGVARKGRRLRSSQKKRKYDEIPDDCDSVIDQQQEESPLPPPAPAKETKKNNKKKQQSKSKMEAEPEPLLPPVNVSPFGNDQLDNNMEGENTCTCIIMYLYVVRY